MHDKAVIIVDNIKLFLVHFRTDEEDLTEYFSKFGALADVYIPRPPRGFAFVTFEKGEDADAVLKVHFLAHSLPHAC